MDLLARSCMVRLVLDQHIVFCGTNASWAILEMLLVEFVFLFDASP